ncbi:hypothetical protein F4802DRAFT_528947 [Xylaria palmicola]|nr:hypothetical protein F4802DRAFT_528947 [Xylaria palmicola]
MKEYSLREVAQHKTADDLWMVVHGQVVDVTKYFKDHPGGPEVMLETAGTNATEAFDDAGHSEEAFEIMEPYVIGTLRGAAVRQAQPETPAVVAPVLPAPVKKVLAKKSSGGVSAGAALAVVLVLGGAVGAAGYSRDLMKTVQNLDARRLVRPICKIFANRRLVHADNLGFLGGFLTASATLLTVGALGFRKIAELSDVGGGFEKYPRAVKAGKPLKRNPVSVRGFLEPGTYHYLPLIEKREVTPGVYRFSFALPAANTVLGLPAGQHVAIKAEVDGAVVSRSYTPVSNNTNLGRLDLVVRCYPDGKLTGRYLEHLALGDEVAFRGPKGAMRYRRGLAKRLAMVAGGTGITPMYQLIRAICEDDEDTTEVSLVYANRSEQDMLLRDELDAFARRYPGNLRVWYLVDKATTPGWEYGEGYVNADVMRQHLPAPDDDGETKLLLCGPPGMINACKKTAASLGFRLGGAVPKMTDQVFTF